MSFSQKVSVEQIKHYVAKGIYENHHSYLPGLRAGTHHGIFYNDKLVGAVTYSSYPSSAHIDGYPPEKIREVGRVAIALDMPNLASCGMAKSQDKYVAAHPDVKVLVTFVREDYEGSMFSALSDKGWKPDRWTEGQPPGNSPNKDIYSFDKQRWVCPTNR